MLRRDFIMVQIEELGKVLAQMIHRRNTDAVRENPALAQTVHDSLKTSRTFLLEKTVNEIHDYLNNTDMAGLQRMEIAAKLLMEESFLCDAGKQQNALRRKAVKMLAYIQQRDTTFSLERMQRINELEQLLAP
ncbi:MAG: hypothetical protein LBD59_00765 [Prevotellaceae bacterium]|jgi:hypothetical protein|nr:hypothetical protein [Prevotellaceae bacterium]